MNWKENKNDCMRMFSERKAKVRNGVIIISIREIIKDKNQGDNNIKQNEVKDIT